MSAGGRADQMRRMTTPSLYLQGSGAIGFLGQKAEAYGNRAFVIGGTTALSLAGDKVRASLESEGVDAALWESGVKECTMATVNRLFEAGRKAAPHMVVGVGGGKAVDTAKAVAWKLKVPAISIGTQCATNADASAESVVYTEDHRFVESIILPHNPVLVLEDTDILAKAPVEFIVRGMGDALSVKFESEAYAKARLRRNDGAVPTGAALALADACFKGLMGHGLKAVRDLRAGTHSSDVDEVIEVVKLSSAIAFENTGCAMAHALHNGLTRTGEVEGEHGEIVAYCTLVQAAYEGRPDAEVSGLVDWCEKVGLPTRLDMLGGPSRAAQRKAAEYAAEKDPDSRNMPEKVRPKDVLKAMEDIEGASG